MLGKFKHVSRSNACKIRFSSVDFTIKNSFQGGRSQTISSQFKSGAQVCAFVHFIMCVCGGGGWTGRWVEYNFLINKHRTFRACTSRTTNYHFHAASASLVCVFFTIFHHGVHHLPPSTSFSTSLGLWGGMERVPHHDTISGAVDVTLILSQCRNGKQQHLYR